MNDQNIRLTTDPKPAEEGVARANRALDSYERTALRAATGAAQSTQRIANGLVTVTQRSVDGLAGVSAGTVRSLERAEAAFEKARQREGVAQQRASELAAVAQEKGTVRAIKASEKAASAAEIAAQRRIAAEARVGSAQERIARQAAESAAREYQRIERAIERVERRAAFSGQSAQGRVRLERTEFTSKIGGNLDPAQAERVSRAFNQIERSAQGAETGVSAFLGRFSGMASTVAVGVAAADLLVGFAGRVKEFTVDAALYAARTETLGFAVTTVGRAAGISEAAIIGQTRAMEKMGLTAQNSRHGLARLIAANIDYRKASELVRAAQDLGTISGQATGDAFERLTHAVVTQQPELARALGLNISYERANLKMARSLGKTVDELTGQERATAALNATLAGAQSYVGAYEARLGTLSGQLQSMPRYIDNIKQKLGEELQPAFKGVAEATLDVVKKGPGTVNALHDIASAINLPFASLSQAVADVTKNWPREAGIEVKLIETGDKDTWEVVRKLLSRAGSTSRGINQVRPGEWTPTPGARWKDLPVEGHMRLDPETDAAWKRTNREMWGKAFVPGMVRVDREQGSRMVKDWRERDKFTIVGMEERLTRLRSERDGYRRSLAQGDGAMTAEDVKVTLGGLSQAERQIQDLESRLAAAKKRTEEVRREQEELRRSQEKGWEIIRQVRGREGRDLAGTKGEIKLDKIEDRPDFAKIEADRLKEALSADEKVLEMRLGTTKEAFDFEHAELKRRYDGEVKALDAMSQRTIERKLYVESRKFEIEQAYLQKDFAAKAAALDAEQQIELAKAGESAALRAAVIERYGEKGRQLMGETRAAMDAASLEASSRITRIIDDQQQRTWDSLRTGFENTLDAMATRFDGFGKYLRNVLLSAILTPVKRAASQWFADAFTPLAMQSQGVAAGGRLGMSGAMVSMAGMTTPGLRMMGGLGGMSPFGVPIATGTTGGVIYGNGASTMGGAGMIQQGLNFGGMKAMGGNLMGGLRSLGNLGMSTKYTDAGFAFQSGKGVGGATGGAMLLGGGALAVDGLRRGGWMGVAETTAGGALIGAKFGGPMGAAIGAAVGFGAGMIRMWFKTAEEKVIEKVDRMYGVRLHERGIARQIVQIAKGTYGGNLDMAVGSVQVREMIELYAMATGQTARGLGPKLRATELGQAGGRLYERATYSNGTLLGAQTSLPMRGGAAAAPTTVVNITIPGAKDFFTQESLKVVANGGKAVQSSIMAAQASNFGRREQMLLQQAPGLLPG